MLDIISAVAAFFSISGNVLVNNRCKAGFIAWIISNGIWIAVELVCYHNWVRLAQMTVYTALAIHGYLKWAKQAKEAKQAEEQA